VVQEEVGKTRNGGPKNAGVEDYGKPSNPDLTFADFPRDFLLKLMQVWQYAWLHITEAWHNAVKKGFGTDTAKECEWGAWLRIGERVSPRYAKIADIQRNTVVDSLKALQLPPDNTAGELFPTDANTIDPNHVIWTIPKCRSQEFFEAKATRRKTIR